MGRRLISITIALSALLAAVPGSASAVVIDGDPLNIELFPDGTFQVHWEGETVGEFTAGAAGLNLGVDVRSFQPSLWGYLGNRFEPGKQTAVSGTGDGRDPFVQTTTYSAPTLDGEALLVTQRASYTNGDRRLRVTYEITHTGGSASTGTAVRPTMSGDATVGGTPNAVGSHVLGEFEDDHISATNAGAGTRTFVDELPSSQWDAFAADDVATIDGQIRNLDPTTGGLRNTTAASPVDIGLGVEWPTTQVSGDITTSFSATWRFNRRLSLTPDVSRLRVGLDQTLEIGTFTESGVPESQFVYVSLPQTTDPALRQTSSSGEDSFVVPSQPPGTTLVTAFVDYNGDARRSAGEPLRTASIEWSNLKLAGGASQRTGQPHTVDASVERDPALVRASLVRYTITGANPGSGSVRPDSTGRAPISWVGANPGIDTVRAFLDLNGDGVRQSVEPQRTRQVEWTNLTLASTPPARSTGQTHSATVQIARDPARTTASQIRYRVTGANPVPTTGLTPRADGSQTISWAGANPGNDTLTAWLDVDGDGARQANEPLRTATVEWVRLTRSPPSATRSAGGTHTVVAKVERAAAASTSPLRYEVTGANPVGSTAVSPSDSTGEAALTWTGAAAGRDTLVAFVDLNGNGTRQLTEPRTTAIVDWVDPLALSPTSARRATGQTQTIVVTARDPNGQLTSGTRVHYFVTGVNPLGSATAPRSPGVTDSSGQVAIALNGTAPGFDRLHVFIDADGDGRLDTTEAQKSAPIEWVKLTLSPTSATRTAGQSHTVALLVERGDPPSTSPVRYSVTGANPRASTSVVPDSSGKAQVSWNGANAGTDTLAAFVDLNNSGTPQSNEPQQQATVTWNPPPPPPQQPAPTAPPPPATLTLSPSEAALPVGQSHTVVAQAANGSGTVRFFVNGAHSLSGSTATDANGGAAFSYPGTSPGQDTITAYLDLNANSVQNSNEPGATATATWNPAQEQPRSNLPPHIPVADSIDELPEPPPFRATNVESAGPGPVFVQLPRSSSRAVSASALRAAQAQGAPKGFVALEQAAQLPIGTIVEATKGKVVVESAANIRGSKTQTARFDSGRFEMRQPRVRRGTPVTEMVLKGGSFRGCPRTRSKASGTGAEDSARRRTSRTRVRRLWGRGRGRFRTRGRYSSATVRGTTWLVEDRCGGTLTRLPRRPRNSRVDVRDFGRRKTIRLLAGKRYLALPRAARRK